MKHAILLLVCSASLYSTLLIHNEVNKQRVNKGLNPLVENSYVCRFAQRRAFESVSDWSHDGFLTTAIPGLGENLSREYDTEGDVIGAWLNSPTHKENLLGNYKFGCVRCFERNCAHIFQQ